jgi:hypothetical protein
VALAGIAVGAIEPTGAFSKSSRSATTSSVVATQTPSIATSASVPAPKPTSTQTSTANVATTDAVQGTTSCGGDLSVGPNTSCGFAHTVEQAYDATTGGSQTVIAFSPATGVAYTINCTGDIPRICSGGTTHDASLYFASGPTLHGSASNGSIPIITPPGTSTSGMRGCGGGVTGNRVTSCPFAQNVFELYSKAYQSNGAQSAGSVTAYNRVTNQTYVMRCDTDGVTVTCTGAKGALISFPLSAAQDY